MALGRTGSSGTIALYLVISVGLDCLVEVDPVARGEEKDRERVEYVRVRSEYKREIKSAKIREMERELKRMGDGVWEVRRRWVKGGRRGVGTNVRRADGEYTQSVEESNRELIDRYFPKDRGEEGEESEVHMEIRMDYDRVGVTGEMLEVTESELKGAIEGLSMGKAPGGGRDYE